MLEIFESLLRLGLLLGSLWFAWAVWGILRGSDSPLARVCLVCDRNLSRGEVVHCANCLGAGR